MRRVYNFYVQSAGGVLVRIGKATVEAEKPLTGEELLAVAKGRGFGGYNYVSSPTDGLAKVMGEGIAKERVSKFLLNAARGEMMLQFVEGKEPVKGEEVVLPYIDGMVYVVPEGGKVYTEGVVVEGEDGGTEVEEGGEEAPTKSGSGKGKKKGGDKV